MCPDYPAAPDLVPPTASPMTNVTPITFAPILLVFAERDMLLVFFALLLQLFILVLD